MDAFLCGLLLTAFVVESLDESPRTGWLFLLGFFCVADGFSWAGWL